MASPQSPAPAMALAVQEEERQQQAVMSSLRTFVDALRDIPSDGSPAADAQQAIRVLCKAPDARWSEQQCRENAWRTGLVPMLQRFCVCMERLDSFEHQQQQQTGPKAKRGEEKPKAPAGLLSLRDYSALQAVMEILLCWAVYPRVESGVLTPIQRRRPTRTLAISTSVLQWGAAGPTPADDGEDLLTAAQVMMQVLFLPQFQPILLPKYTLELLAVLVFGGEVKSGVRVETEAEFRRLRELITRSLPLRLVMGSMRAALEQATGRSTVVTAFKKRCGYHLSRLAMEDEGVMTIIEILLGGVEDGNTQARMQVVTLVCQCPSDVEPDAYMKILCRQVRGLLSPATRDSKLLCEMGVLLADRIASTHGRIFDAHLMTPMFEPLLRYEDNDGATSNRPGSVTIADELDLAECVTAAHLLICGPPPSKHLLQALAPVMRPLIHMYAFAVNSKSFQRQPLQDILVAWIKLAPWASVFLQLAVIPVSIPTTPSLPSKDQSTSLERTLRSTMRREFCAGGSGGIAMRQIPSGTSEETVKANLQSVIEPLVEVLTLKELESVAVVGDLFASLLLTYMAVKRKTSAPILPTPVQSDDWLSVYNVAKAPATPVGVEMVLFLLLSVTESLGPAVLRSAETILQCIATVLATFNSPTTRLIDAVDGDTSLIRPAETEEPDEDEEDSAEMLTICLGVVMTILEAGSSQRSASEEAELKRMLPVLESLSHHSQPDIAELASEARVRILSREAGYDASTSSHNEAHKQESFSDVLERAEADLRSALVPLRARGVVSLTKLVRTSQLHRGESNWTPKIELLVKIFLRHLEDAESYVFLAAVQGLSTLADIHPDVAIPLLVAALQDHKRQYSLPTRIKLSEALLFTAKRCGETLPKYAKVFVYAYLDCIRPASSTTSSKRAKAAAKRVSLIQEISTDDVHSQDSTPQLAAPAASSDTSTDSVEVKAIQLEEATFRASCLSNMAEVCALLQWSLQPFAVDVITCVLGVLQLELDDEPCRQPGRSIDMTPVKTIVRSSETDDDDRDTKATPLPPPAPSAVIAVRRGAVFVLKYLIQLLGWKALDMLPDHLQPMYHTLKHVARTDRDAVVVFHAQRALDALGDVMRAELFPRVEQQDEAFGIASKLRIV